MSEKISKAYMSVLIYGAPIGVVIAYFSRVLIDFRFKSFKHFIFTESLFFTVFFLLDRTLYAFKVHDDAVYLVLPFLIIHSSFLALALNPGWLGLGELFIGFIGLNWAIIAIGGVGLTGDSGGAYGMMTMFPMMLFGVPVFTIGWIVITLVKRFQ